MTTRAVAEMDDWDTVPFGGGYAGLRDLADAEFSGIVQSGAAKCCLLNGTVVGVLDGRIEDFEDADGTAYEAPTPALPLLALMQERGDEVKAKYYTEDTPLSEVDRKLSEGGFSGYIELSENVLSGDYYTVYHAGRSMSVAWVGNMGELLTDDEAFRRADDEVGIYEVRQADVEPVEIPGGSNGSSTGATAAGGVAGAGTGGAGPETNPGGETGDRAATDDGSGAESTRAATDSTSGATGTDGTVETAGADDGATGDDSDGLATGTTSSSTADGEAPATDGHETAVESADGSSDEGDSVDDSADDSRSESTRSTTDPAVEESPTASKTDPSGAEASRTGEVTETTGGEGPTDVAERADAAVTDSTTAEPTDTTPEPAEDSDDRRRARDQRGSSDADATTAGAGGLAGTERPESTTREAADSRGSDAGDTHDSGSSAVSPADRLATRSIPSLAPSRTTDDVGSDGVVGADGPSAGTSRSEDTREQESSPPSGPQTAESAPEHDTANDTDPDRAESQSESAVRDASGGSGAASSPETTESDSGSRPATDESGRGTSSERVAELEAELEERDAEIERLESELAAAESEREDLRRELETVRDERDALQSERDVLQSERDELAAELDEREAELQRVRGELNELEAELGGASDAEQRLSPAEALDGTNLFVRYESKGKATLESAHGGSASREEVDENLNLELHTQFDAASATVGSQPYEPFLRGTLQYRFVDWVVGELLWEIRDTGKAAALEGLYDAIPQIDRAELDGTVTVEFTEDGQQRRSEESFDIVLRDRMGNPLVVANLNDSRQAASQEMMNTLVTAGSRVAESSPSLAAAVFVTSSFFEPGALETAADATSGSLLSRDKRESFVKLSRKQGYHLCLTEAREEQFHLAVPEL